MISKCWTDSHFFQTDYKQLLIILHLICRKSRWENNPVCCSITPVGQDAALMWRRVQLLRSCWIICAVESAQLKKNEPHHLSRACSNRTHKLIALLGLDTYCSTCFAPFVNVLALNLYTLSVLSRKNSGWNASSHLTREKACGKITLCWPAFLCFFSLSFLSLHGLVQGQILYFCWARWQYQNM